MALRDPCVWNWLGRLQGLVRDEKGQDGMEYAIVAAIIIVAAGAALQAGAPSIKSIIDSALSAVSSQIP